MFRGSFFSGLALAPLAAMWGLATCQAQVVLDGKFGSSGALSGPNYQIPAELGSTRGNNLFHSFSQFDLRAGDVASFSGPANIQNILSRVTGSRSSSIDGTLRSEIAGANFYFINPRGIVFGPNAAVDVSGAFAASTANYLRLADDARFVASLAADDSVLSSAPVAAFGFLAGANGNLRVRGSLRSSPDSPLTLVGSTVSVTDGAKLEAMGSQIRVTGVSGAGEILAEVPTGIQGGTLSPPASTKPGSIVIRGGRLVVENARISTSTTGGDIDVATTDSVEVSRGGQVTAEALGANRGGNILIESPAIRVDGQGSTVPTRLAAETSSTRRTGAGGDVVLRSDTLEVLSGGEISVSTFGAADAGTIDIKTGLLRLAGAERPAAPTQISANAAPVSGAVFGAGGRILIDAQSLEISKGAVLSASTLGDANAGSIEIKSDSIAIQDSSVTTYSTGAGNAGNIRVDAGELTLDGRFGSITSFALGVDSHRPAGKGGEIEIQAEALTLRNEAAIAAGTYGDGDGGNVRITAGSVLLDTGNPQPGIFPGISASSGLAFDGWPNTGASGDIFMSVDSLTVQNGMLITATTATPGRGGNIEIQAGSVNLANRGSIQAASEGIGLAGNIRLQASGSVELAADSSVSTSAPLSSGGNIEVRAGKEVRLANSQFSARAGPGGGGNIDVSSPHVVYLLDSAFDAQAVGDGGNLTISQPVFFLINDSGLISKSATQNGGNITILSDYFFASESTIDASAPFGLPGTVTVSAPNVDLSGSLIGLPGGLLDAEALLRPDCAVRFAGSHSSFLVLGRGGVPWEPGGLAPTAMAPTRDDER